LAILLDIKPGSNDNPLNLKSKGVLPVAVYGSADLDVTQIDLATLLLNGVGVRVKPNGDYHASFDDINGDGVMDLVLHFATQALGIDPADVELLLTGMLTDGTEIEGGDGIRTVPDFNGDLLISATDLARLKADFGFSEPVTGQAIPEPAAMGLLALGGLALLRKRS
jgi:MYXO-CTERM domain-containing protein